MDTGTNVGMFYFWAGPATLWQWKTWTQSMN